MNKLVKTITERKSTRTFENRPISEETKIMILEKIRTLTNPFDVKIRYNLIDNTEKDTTQKLGTYGVIRNPSNFITATLVDDKFALEALGYEMEDLILYLTNIGIGSCWLGGTFNRGQFAKEVGLKEDEIIPIILPIGYIADKKSITEKVMRKMSKGDSRKDWLELFFKSDFNTQLLISEAGVYSEALEMVRLGPSASNKQPWRIIKDGNKFHFYEYSTPGYSKMFSYDIQRIDMGIAAAHFSLSAKAKGFVGNFSVEEPSLKVPENTLYKFTWIGDENMTGKAKEIVLAGGCFWGTEKYLSLIKGIISTEVGYANGNTPFPTYQDVCYKDTGHTEAVKVIYDSAVINLTAVLSLFYDVINPTSINKQGNDVGSQYRSGIYYVDESDLEVIQKSIIELQAKYDEKIAIEVLPLDNYTTAEEYHQKYLDKNPGGYCHIGPDKFKKAMDS
ncbi:MAG: hypothetical protein FD141_136 [Fusobacteria bacterium]|nr:MAG: hypothetical protein FD141_136 [Fusobacteriota bacterium]KAF0229200.1 MAG: hypothetical protein FD182_1456 [Fusobacteriota bacterium]